MHTLPYLSTPGVLEQPVRLVRAVLSLHLAVAHHNHGMVQGIIAVACMGSDVMLVFRQAGLCSFQTFDSSRT